MRCSICSKKIWFYQRTFDLIFSGRVHEKCFIRSEGIPKVKGMSQENIIK